jgi:DNA-binding MarR family transcriptional regulator
MPVRLDNVDDAELLDAERDIQAKLNDGAGFDFTALQAISNVYRAANAVRNFMERDLLAAHGLSWGGFTAMFVLWVWGPLESRQLADECGMAKGTMTGVVATLERAGLASRRRLPEDRRRVEVALTADGDSLITELFPQFHQREVRLTAQLSVEERATLARLLRKLISGTD